jgi:hypothetical protein
MTATAMNMVPRTPARIGAKLVPVH